MIITLVFEKNAIFCRKLSKIAENCDHNIDPRLSENNDNGQRMLNHVCVVSSTEPHQGDQIGRLFT
jgi:hypothetical protein